jgi:hypothetical protein
MYAVSLNEQGNEVRAEIRYILNTLNVSNLCSAFILSLYCVPSGLQFYESADNAYSFP